MIEIEKLDEKKFLQSASAKNEVGNDAIYFLLPRLGKI